MITETTKSFNEIISKIPNNYNVLDVGGAMGPTARANYIIDYISYDNISLNQAKGGGPVHFSKQNYIQHDICSRKGWPFQDKQFDYSICSHVLEDIRDPIWVCSEIIRVSRAGYIEVPSRIYESSFCIEAKKTAGASHHRWFVELIDGKLAFTFKNFYIHYKFLNKIKCKKAKDNYLRIEWSDDFYFYENWLNSGKEMFEYILGKKINDKEKWNIVRKIGCHSYLIGWLKYLKNTNKLIEKIFNKFIK